MSEELSQEWNEGCEAFYMGVPVFHNPYDEHGSKGFDRVKYQEWEDGWEYAWLSNGKPAFN